MRIFLHTDSDLTLQDIDETTTVAEISEAVGIDDATGWPEDGDEPLATEQGEPSSPSWPDLDTDCRPFDRSATM